MREMSLFGQATKVLEEQGRVTPAIGIDLGTTNSCVAVIQSGNTPKIITLDGGARTMPSCVQWKGKKDQFVVGRDAYTERYKASTVYSVKRLMGTDEKVTLKYGQKELTMTPSEVSAEILRELVKQASKEYKGLKDVVITVPAYFNNRQISDTVEAGKLAGLNVLATLREPTAASLVYNSESKENKDTVVLVYDLGGGTMDVSLVRISRGEGLGELADFYGIEEDSDSAYAVRYTVLDTDGDSRLGGDDIDQQLYKILERKLSGKGHDVSAISREDREKTILRLERLKKAGSAGCSLDLKFKSGKGIPAINETVDLNYADFVEATRVIYNRSKVKIDSVLSRAGGIKIDSIALVGGSTKSEILREMIRNDFAGVHVDSAMNPDESVALGAAIKAKEVKFGDKSVEVFDILPMNIGVVSDGFITPVIRKNQRVPCSAKRRYSTVEDNQKEIELKIYQGNSPLVEECQYLGTLLYKNVPEGKAGEVNVVVHQKVDSNGLLTVSVQTENGTQEVELVNILGSSVPHTNKRESARERRVSKWINFANTLEEGPRKEILSVVDEFNSGLANSKKVSEIISKYLKDTNTVVKYERPQQDMEGI